MESDDRSVGQTDRQTELWMCPPEAASRQTALFFGRFLNEDHWMMRCDDDDDDVYRRVGG